MKVYIEKENKNMELKFEGTVTKLLLTLKINPETVIVTRKDELLSEEDNLKNSDSIRILSVISGG